MKRSNVLSILGLFVFSLLLRTIPFFDFVYWGTDCGEYFYYTQRWIGTGQAYTAIDGWGNAYPFFPGMYTFSGGLHLTTTIPLQITTVLFPAVLSSLTIIFIFVLVHSITKKVKGSLVSAFFLSILAPFVYNYSQPKPETVGFFLMVLLLIMVIRFKPYNKKILYLMIPTSFALVITHHLTSYFFALFLFGGIFTSMIVRRKTRETDKLRLYFFVFFISLTLFYWMIFAPPFREDRLLNALGTPSYSILAAPFVFIALTLLLKKLRDRSDFRLSIQFEKENARSILLLSLPPVAIGVALLLYSSFFNVPGTAITLGASALLYIPLISFAVFIVPSRVPIRIYRDGLQVWGWLLFTLLSFAAGVITGSSSLLPMRQVVFMMLPVSILLGIGITESFKLLNPISDRKKTIAILSILILLFAWNLPFIYPSQEMMDGYQEGSDTADIETGYWLKGTDKKVATDHRLSATVFALSNKNLTWTEGSDIYFSTDPDQAYTEAEDMNITYIMWDSVMEEGVMTTAQETAPPVDDELINEYGRSNFLVYDNGDNVIFFLKKHPS